MDGTLLQQGGTLMLVGMGTVFVFLTSLVFALALMAKVAPLFEKPEIKPDSDSEVVAAITAAIRKHRGS